MKTENDSVKSDFEAWWASTVRDSNQWTTIERLAAHDAWQASRERYAPKCADLERRNAELKKAIDWVLSDYDGMCRYGYPPSENWKKRIVAANSALKFSSIDRTKEQSK